MSTTTTPPAAGTTPAKAKQQTAYHVFKAGPEATYQLVGPNVTAQNAEAAIKAHVEKSGETTGKFAAVPSRGWKQLSLKVETRTSITLT